MDENVICERILQTFPQAQIQLRDLTGTRDHWGCTVITDAFEGMGLVRRHQAVYACLNDLMAGDSAPIHALQLNTLTPAEVQKEA